MDLLKIPQQPYFLNFLHSAGNMDELEKDIEFLKFFPEIIYKQYISCDEDDNLIPIPINSYPQLGKIIIYCPFEDKIIQIDKKYKNIPYCLQVLTIDDINEIKTDKDT